MSAPPPLGALKPCGTDTGAMTAQQRQRRAVSSAYHCGYSAGYDAGEVDGHDLPLRVFAALGFGAGAVLTGAAFALARALGWV